MRKCIIFNEFCNAIGRRGEHRVYVDLGASPGYQVLVHSEDLGGLTLNHQLTQRSMERLIAIAKKKLEKINSVEVPADEIAKIKS